MKIPAAIALGNKAPLVVEDVEIAEPTGYEVPVRVVATGICGTDLRIIDHTPLPWAKLASNPSRMASTLAV